MYLAFALIAGASGLAAWQAEDTERRRAEDADLIAFAAAQSAVAERIGRLALALTLGRVEDDAASVALAGAVDASKDLALRFDPQLERGLAALTPSQPQSPLADWHQARERLWYRADVLLQRSGDGAAAVNAATAALVAETARSAEAADRLVQALRSASQERGRASVQWVREGGLLTLALLGLLALLVVEPTVRAVRHQHRRLADQAAELERLALVAEHTDNLVVITDLERRIVWVNEAFSRVTGHSLAEARGQVPAQLLHSPRADPARLERLREALAQGQSARAELLNRSKDGRDYWVDADMQPLHGADGTLTGFMSVETEITAQVTERLKTTALLAALPDGVVLQAPDGRIVDVNPAAEQLLGQPRAALLGRDPAEPLWQAVREDMSDYPPGQRPAQRTLRSGHGLRGEVMGVQGPDGTLRWLLVNTEPLRDALDRPAGVVTCFVDISERRQLQDQLARTARIDALTALPNRAVAMERIEQALAHRRRHAGYGFAVLFMDLDRFKQVNDTHGHGAGDALLRQIAQRLTETLRPGDAVARVGSESRTAARIGGDEFVVVLEGVHDTAAVHVVVDRLLLALAEPYLVGGHSVLSSASIGVVLDPQADASADSVLRDADTAMYEAKRAGRGRYVVFDASMHDRVAATLALENDLRRALRERELFVVYQPVLRLADGQLQSVEALVRWRHPGRGVVAPAEFVALAEETGLIGELGDFVLDAACRQLARWKRTLGRQAPGVVAVNLSRAQLGQPDLAARVRAVLAGAGLAPAELQLEVTESLAAQDASVQAMLTELKATGVRLALDDFGTGYSSLACLHRMPVDTVKIDRSFVGDAEDSGYHRVVIEASVAEGIETEAQVALMLALGCQLGQGYLFSRPVEAHALTRWLRAGQPRLALPAGRSSHGDADAARTAGAAGADTAADRSA